MDSIIFDVDGTLWDSRAVVAQSWNKVIRKHSDSDVVVTEEGFTSLFGKPVNEITDAIFPDMSEEEKRRLEILLLEYENEYILDNNPGTIYKGVRETIVKLSEQYPLYLASNCYLGYIEAFLEVTDLKPCFKDHICYGDTGLSKGKNLLLLKERNNLKTPIYIGDTQGDGDAAKEANMPFVYVTYGFGTIENPDYTIDEISSLLSIVEKM